MRTLTNFIIAMFLTAFNAPAYSSDSFSEIEGVKLLCEKQEENYFWESDFIGRSVKPYVTKTYVEFLLDDGLPSVWSYRIYIFYDESDYETYDCSSDEKTILSKITGKYVYWRTKSGFEQSDKKCGPKEAKSTPNDIGRRDFFLNDGTELSVKNFINRETLMLNDGLTKEHCRLINVANGKGMANST